MLVVAGVALTPFAALRLMSIPSYMLAFGSAMLSTNLLLAGLLLSRGRSERNGAASRLGTAYCFVAVIFLPMMAAFPDAIPAGSLIGSKYSAVWIWSFWHAGFGLLVLRYVRAVRQERTRPWAELTDVAATIALVRCWSRRPWRGSAGCRTSSPARAARAGVTRTRAARHPVNAGDRARAWRRATSSSRGPSRRAGSRCSGRTA